ncbi:MAG: MG2 domain-containing protein [Candidatus Sericytochromatia bacterium]|nr:MG2 domain-containing protein [Candidatus Sericytochromatia bacterium]
MTAAPDRARSSWRALLVALAVLVALAGLGAGAIALEPPTGTVAGQVRDTEGRPLGRARVVASGAVTRVTTALADGSYTFWHLPVGEYLVSAKAPGHEPAHLEDALTLREGQRVADVAFRLTRTTPSVAITNVQRVVLPTRPLRVMARGNQLDALAVTLHRLDLAAVVAADPRLESLRGEPNMAALARAGRLQRLRHWRVPVARHNREDEDWFHQPIEVSDLAPGAYMVEVRGQPGPDRHGRPRAAVQDAWYFTVGPLALVCKRGEDGLVAWVTDAVRRRPVPGAAVRVHGARLAGRVWRTDADGLVRLPVTTVPESVTVSAEQGGAIALAQAGWWGSGQVHDVYAFTDRPVYRPGHTVHLKGFVRRRLPRGFALAAGRPVRLTVLDGRGEEVTRLTRTLGPGSAFEADVALPEAASLGEWRIDCRVGSDYAESVAFQVADYRKPELKVELTPTRTRWIRGETAEVGLVASYYFGAPVPGARLQATVYSAPDVGSPPAGEQFFAGFLGEGFEPAWGLGDVVQTTELVADATGNARLSVPLATPADAEAAAREGDRRFTVVVEGADATGRPVKAQAAFQVVQAAVRVHVEAEQELYEGRRELGLRLRTEDHEGRPRALPVRVRLVRLETEQRQTAGGDVYLETLRVPVGSVETRTDARGRGRAVFPASGPGSYEIEAEVVDERGRAARDLAWTWVAADDEAPSTYHYGSLQLAFDRAVYRPGDVARVLVVSPIPDAHVLVTIEGRRVEAPRVLRLRGTSGRLDLPVSEAMTPNVHVSAVIVNGLEYIPAARSLNVLPEARFLKVALEADVARARPGQRVAWTVTTRDWQDRPVPAEVALGVVDEAIYAIEPDRTPEIRHFFHGPRWNAVSTAYSFAEDYSGGLDKFGPDPRVRARFEDTAAWFPSLQTGPDGRARVEVELPDNLTTWVATARAITPATQVGSASHRLVATKDLLVRLEAPRFVHVGDEVQLVAVAHNYTPGELSVELALETTGLEPAQPAPVVTTVAAGGSGRAAWTVRAPEAGALGVKVVARAAGAEGDAMAVTLPARPFGLPEFQPVVLEPGAAAAAFQVPDGLGPARLEVSLPGSVAGALRTSVGYLQGYPYGCAEQEASRLVPAAVVWPRWREAGLAEGELGLAAPARSLRQGLQRLLAAQHGDGGWGWWSHDVSRPALTAQVMGTLAVLPEVGVPVPGLAVRRALARMHADLAATGRHAHEADTVALGRGPDVRAQLLHALAAWKAAPGAELERLWADREALSPQGLARLALALQASGRPDLAREAIRRLRGQASVSETQAFWAQQADQASWLGSATEATAWGLRALVAVAPQDPLAPKVARWLMSRNARGWWSNTRDTAAAAWALADWLRLHPPGPASRWAATVSVDGRAVASWEHPGGADVVPPRWDVPVTPGSHRLSLQLAGEAPPAPGLLGGLSFLQDAMGLAPRDGPEGLRVRRRYLRLPAGVLAAARGRGRGLAFEPQVLAGLPEWRGEAKLGENILVELRLETARARRWMCLRDPLPAGVEAVPEPSDGGGAYWWEHQELRDEEAVFFFTELKPGERVIHHLVRPATPGRFRALPPQAWAMYDPEIRARGAMADVSVGGGP